MKSEATIFAERLRAALVKAKVSDKPVELMKLVPAHGGENVSQQAVSNWLNGKNMPRSRNIRALAKLARIDPLRLQLGDEEARRVREQPAVWNAKASALDQHAIDDYFALPETQRKLVRELIDELSRGNRKAKPSR